MEAFTPSQEFVDYICSLYGSAYDDREENWSPPTTGTTACDPGEDWIPGQVPDHHKSLNTFQKELADIGINISSTKLRKILITGKKWSTHRSRQIFDLFDEYTRAIDDGGYGLNNNIAVTKIATKLDVSVVTVSVNLPYQNVVYNLENKSSNAKRCARYKERKRQGLTRKLK